MSSTSGDGRSFVHTLGGTTSGSGIRVLHVDDEPDFADLVSIYLEREGDALEVVTENAVDDALERLEADRFDCVLSDYDMPGANGLEFLDAVRSRHGDLPFILFTGKGSEEIASDAISAGVTDYLQKNGSVDQYAVLANRIENATRQHRAERAVRHGFDAIETAREGIAFLDEQGRFLYANDAYGDVYGYASDELVGEHWGVLYPDDHVDQVYEEILPALPECGTWTGESVHVCRNGQRLVVDHAVAYTDEDLLVCLIQDITEEKATERALERERQRFELFVENVDEYAIFALDADGFVTSWNQGARRLKGYDTEEILGDHVSVFYPDDQDAAGRPEELLATARKMGTATDTGWRVRADGTQFWADVTITAVFDEEGRHRGYLKVTEDVTDEHAAATRSGPNGDFVERSLDVLEDVFYVLDRTGDIVRVTERAVDVTGYARDELTSMSPEDLFADVDRPEVQQAVAEAVETGDVTLAATLETARGELIPYEFRTRRLVDDDGTVYLVGVGRDVSERERRERRLTRQLEQFEHFGAVLSHDVRTPLNTARGRLELARETGDDEHLAAVEESLDRLGELIEDLAGVMREGELVGDLEPVDLGECLQSAWATLDTGDATLDVTESAVVLADATALKRLAENLFSNAVDHGGDVTVTVGTLPDGFYVADDGPGIPERDRERVFEAGYSTRSAGGGLGLASVKQLAVAHGWGVAATDSESRGARFEITDVEFCGE